MSTQNAVANSKVLGVFIPEVMSAKLNKILDKSGVMMECVNRDHEGEVRDSGDTVKINQCGDVAVSTYSGSISSYETLTGSQQELLIDQEVIFAFKVPDVSKAQATIDVNSKYLERARIAIDLNKDTFLLGKHSSVTSGNTIGTVTTPIALTKDNIYGYMCDLYEKLETANALADGKMPWVIVNPKIKNLIKKSPEFISASNMGDVVKRKGTIGEIAGFQVLVSTNFVAVSSKYYILAGTNDAITFASQVTKVESMRDPDSFSDLVRGLYVYGAKVVVPGALAKIIATVA